MVMIRLLKQELFPVFNRFRLDQIGRQSPFSCTQIKETCVF
jgi:hypothetical protein